MRVRSELSENAVSYFDKRQLWKSALVLVAVGAGLAVTTLAFFLSAVVPSHCDEWSQDLARDAKHGTVKLDGSACTRFGTTVIEKVIWVSPEGNRQTVFEYEPPGGITEAHGTKVEVADPKAAWISSGELRISIDAVGRVLKKRETLDDVKVSYDIGLIVFK
jgi:hypothetical protein